MRICIDLDGVVCQLRRADQTYAELDPVEGAPEALRALRAAGHVVILSTARHMKTTAGNPGLALARQGKVTLDWLDAHGIEFDEIHFGKPHADVYIDDNAVRFTRWADIAPDGANLPVSAETARDAANPLPEHPEAVVIVIPMAGRGQRFRDAGYQLPKPLIPVRGVPMYAWAMRSLPLEAADRVVFVCLESDLVDHGLGDDIRDRYRDHDPVVVSVPEVTDGQLCSVLAARETWSDDESLVIYNADTYVVPSIDPPWGAPAPGVDGSLGVFRTELGDHWSFVEPDADGRVIRTAEKERISSWASTGLYHFARVADFVEAADAAMAAGEVARGEYYVAPLYNRLIQAGAHIVMDEAREVWPLGTPAELDAFLDDPASPAPAD